MTIEWKVFLPGIVCRYHRVPWYRSSARICAGSWWPCPLVLDSPTIEHFPGSRTVRPLPKSEEQTWLYTSFSNQLNNKRSKAERKRRKWRIWLWTCSRRTFAISVQRTPTLKSNHEKWIKKFVKKIRIFSYTLNNQIFVEFQFSICKYLLF